MEGSVPSTETRTWVGKRSDPRGPQVAFLVPVTALLLVVLVMDPSRLLLPRVTGSMAVVAVATALTLLVPWARLPLSALVVVPVLDMLAIGLLRLGPDGGGIGGLIVFPAIWLGTVFRSRGVVIATLGSVLFLTIPGIVFFGSSVESWSRALLLPVVALVTASSLSVTVDRWDQHRRELVEAVDEITHQRRLNDAILNTVDVGLLALGPDGSYSSMNPRQREFLAIAHPEGHDGMAGQVGYAYGTDRTTPLQPEEMPSVRASRGETFSDHRLWVGQDHATQLALSVSGQPMFAADGSIEGAVLAYKDVTELMRAMQVKDDFVASVSHELRTPLTSIIGYIDLVTDEADTLPADVVAHLRVVRRNAERLHLLVSDLLTTALTDAGSLHLTTSPTDLGMLVRAGVEAARTRALDAGVRLDVEVGSLPPLDVDPVRMAQVVDNLLSNAVKYTLDGGRITVRLAEDGDEVELTVTDTGIGMSAEDQARVFTKFFRGRTAEERAIPGVGLGLVITRTIVQAHRGSVTLESQEGVGTVARVRLPLRHGSPAVEAGSGAGLAADGAH